jgi:hypothetical protein
MECTQQSFRISCKFQPFLRFWITFIIRGTTVVFVRILFQPFLRFWSLCSWFLRVFKFFFGFLSFRRSAWNHALHSFHTALGKIDAPFFGAPKKEKRERRRKRTPFFAVGGFVGRRRRVQSAEVRPGRGCSAAWWIRGRGGGFMWRLGLCVSRSGRRHGPGGLFYLHGGCVFSGVWVVGALKFI